ncbi:MAG TPA: hypothetical protein PKH65_05050 [Bacteroidia bacterium]|nr:hypothetical protein [Bacteroidia bacterium]HNT80028.1 hypothetical protein [Bacteroidia bacterium]
MKKFIVLFFAIVLVLFSWQNLLTYGAFIIKSDFIADVICINRDTEKAKSCHGKCYLKLKFEENNTTNETSLIVYNSFELIYLPTENDNTFVIEEKDDIKFSDYTIQITQGISDKLFVPPEI